MSLVKWAIFGLLILPLVEIVIFIVVAVKIGFLTALALTILTTLAGMSVIRNAGSGELQRVRTAFGDRVITRMELDGPGFLTVLAGVLLAIPGFLTDILGILLLLPVTRRLLHAALRRAVSGAQQPAGEPGVIDLAPDQWRQVPDERHGRMPPPRRD